MSRVQDLQSIHELSDDCHHLPCASFTPLSKMVSRDEMTMVCMHMSRTRSTMKEKKFPKHSGSCKIMVVVVLCYRNNGPPFVTNLFLIPDLLEFPFFL